jgi:peptide/nickel transport system ATP-binding protein
LAGQGRGLLVATHDVEFALAAVDRVVILAEGVVVEHGPARQVLSRPAHEATRQLLRAPSGIAEDVPAPSSRRSGLHGKEHV